MKNTKTTINQRKVVNANGLITLISVIGDRIFNYTRVQSLCVGYEAEEVDADGEPLCDRTDCKDCSCTQHENIIGGICKLSNIENNIVFIDGYADKTVTIGDKNRMLDINVGLYRHQGEKGWNLIKELKEWILTGKQTNGDCLHFSGYTQEETKVIEIKAVRIGFLEKEIPIKFEKRNTTDLFDCGLYQLFSEIIDKLKRTDNKNINEQCKEYETTFKNIMELKKESEQQ